MERGKLITIEGIEGAGKSSAVECIRQYLADRNIYPVFTREPGGTDIAEEIRKVLLHPVSNEKMQPKTELLLMFACRAQLISHLVGPALQAGKWVVSDRYIDASYAYQGFGRQIDLGYIEQLDNMIVGPVYPSLTFLLDVPVDVGLQRAFSRGNGKDRIEQEKVEFFTRVREGYLQRLSESPNRIKLIDASKTKDEVMADIIAVLDVFLASEAA
jgi:dTMP kinase